MKRFFIQTGSVFLSLAFLLSLSTNALAIFDGDKKCLVNVVATDEPNEGQSDGGYEFIDNLFGDDDTLDGDGDITDAVSPVSDFRIAIVSNSICIPDSTPFLSSGVVWDGLVTYEINIAVRVSENGMPCSGKTVLWSTNISPEVRYITSSIKTDGSGTATATYHTRSLSSFTVTAQCDGRTTSATITPKTVAQYKSSFYITYYWVALEEDYKGSKVAVPELGGNAYKKDFLDSVRMEGSGKGLDGKYISYYNGVYAYRKPTTSTGTTPTAGRTIAVDPYYIPEKVSLNRKGTVDIQNVGLREAEDIGPAIKGFHIDVFVGEGEKMKPGNNFNARVTYMGNNRWKSLGTFAELDEGDMSNFDNNELFIPEITNVWYSPDHTRYGYVINDLASGSLQIGISDTGTERNSADDMVLELPVVAKSVNDVSFIDACRVGVLSHVNPSTDGYFIWDLESGLLTECYYGYGFTTSGDTIYYIQAPQHFSGMLGFNRILTNRGELLYESDENVIILPSLTISGNEIGFSERNILTDQTNENICSTLSAIRTDGNAGYY